MSNRKQREAEVFRHTVRPGISTPVFLKTLPGATCLLRRAEDTDPERRLKYIADDDGIICVHVRPSFDVEDVAKFEIECSTDGRVKYYPLELRASQKETPEMPFPARQRPARKKRGTIRPALSEKEALGLSREELREKGYPPRPDPQTLAAFKTWLKAVSFPMTMVEPRLVTNTGVSHQSLQWSGFSVGGPESTYAFSSVTGNWIVPNLVPARAEANTPNYSALWVGIDGTGGGYNDLIQAGTEQDILELDFPFGTFSFTNYYAWTQFLPHQQSEQTINNLSVSPGNEMVVWVVLADTNAYFQVENYSTGKYTAFFTPFGKTAVPAVQAEWIMERPVNTLNNTPYDLACYYFAIMRNAWASIQYEGVINYQGIWIPATGARVESSQITMENPVGHILSQAYPNDEDSMYFIWRGYH